MNKNRFLRALALIDAANASDPNWETWQDQPFPKTYLYGQRMTEWLVQLYPGPPEATFLAARAQHTCRWLVPRHCYPKGRRGYLEWRSFLYRLHADKASQLLRAAGYDPNTIDQVKRILLKRGLHRDPQVQMVEDASCLVFLQFYFVPFARGYDQHKLIEIVRKTWKKMSESARHAALELDLGEFGGKIVREVLSD